MNEQQRFQHILDECVERVLAGEPIESLAASYPEYASTLMMLLRSVNDMRGAAIGPAASHEARERARAGMLAGITATGSAGQSRAAEQGGVGMWMWFRGRPVVYQGLALLAGVALLGGVAAGASAAGSAPEPVRELFGFREDSAIGVEFTGIVVSVDVTGASLTVTGDDTRVVFVDGATEISDGGDLIALDDLQPGDVVEVKGSLQADNTILASRLHREDGDDDTDDGRTPTPGATPLPTSDATPGDDDDRDDGNSGPDNHDVDDANDDDNSGPGDGDDADDDDNSGPGNANDDDDMDDDDSSGPGSGDDDDDDAGDGDNSGPGSGGDDDDAADDDHSGSGGSSDDD